MKTIEKEMVLEALESAGLDEENLYADYSGRAMYGRQCFGIVVGGATGLVQFMVALHEMAQESTWEFNEDEFHDMTHGIATDQMGLDIIYYFPSFNVVDG